MSEKDKDERDPMEEHLLQLYDYSRTLKHALQGIRRYMGDLEAAEMHLSAGIKRCISEAERRPNINETIAEAQAKYGELLERLATTNAPPSNAEEHGRLPDVPIYTPVVDEPPEETIRRMRDGAPPPPGIFPPVVEKPFVLEDDTPESPIEVEMRTRVTTYTRYWWEARIADAWLTTCYGEQRNTFDTRSIAMTKGRDWLAALGDQLGVELVAKWEGDR